MGESEEPLMTKTLLLLAAALLLQDSPFNGKDLSGWKT